MKVPRAPHRWSLTLAEAVAVQRRLAGRVEQARLDALPRLVGGLDATFLANICIAAAVSFGRVEPRVVEPRIAARPLRFPYVPGLLSFREAPALLAAPPPLVRGSG